MMYKDLTGRQLKADELCVGMWILSWGGKGMVDSLILYEGNGFNYLYVGIRRDSIVSYSPPVKSALTKDLAHARGISVYNEREYVITGRFPSRRCQSYLVDLDSIQCHKPAKDGEIYCSQHLDILLGVSYACICGRSYRTKGALTYHKNNTCLYKVYLQDDTRIILFRNLVALDLGKLELLTEEKYGDLAQYFNRYSKGGGDYYDAPYIWNNPNKFYTIEEWDEFVKENRSVWRNFAKFRDHVLGRIDYHEYISSPEWKKKSLEAKKRAGYKCAVCNSRIQLDTHHNTYERLGREVDEDLIVLCRECHGIFHKAGKIK